ncbi:GNAT family N-acetyltransferase [Clostridium sp. KNHs214]|uniref:GNAT family N-acetyltransferase n=1 Tax=Clostridium sp. KNHs214 TaxID=1540257 RepID=UPI00068B2237|nr:GNAT family N-acetyltransferase [Clostridium sp. KNHs214]
MFQVDLNFKDIYVDSIDKKDLVEVYNWIKRNNVYNDRKKNLSFKEFCDRFLEYYLGEGEVFLKITKDSEVIGILKGRIEFKNPNEFWIRYFGMNANFMDAHIQKMILRKIIKVFNSYGIEKFYVIISSEEKEDLNFWNKNGFLLVRVCSDIVNIKGKDKTFILLKEKNRI